MLSQRHLLNREVNSYPNAESFQGIREAYSPFEVNSYPNTESFQGIREAYSPFEVLLFKIVIFNFIKTNIIHLMLWKAIKTISSNKVQSKVKWRSHPSILALVSEHKNMAKTFSFYF